MLPLLDTISELVFLVRIHCSILGHRLLYYIRASILGLYSWPWINYLYWGTLETVGLSVVQSYIVI